MKIAFLGLGIMGSRMAANLLKAGHELKVWNRHPAKAADLMQAGAYLATSPQDAVKDVEVCISMLSTPEVVEEIAIGENGFLSSLTTNAIWIDSSTVNPSFSIKMAREAAARNVLFLEAPVAGTKGPAEKGELLFLVAGPEKALTSCTPLFDTMGKKTLHLGAYGQGASMKMLINLLLAQQMLAFAEAAALGKGLGLPEEAILNVLLATPVTAPFLSAVRPKIDTQDYEANFPLKWIQKDLHLATISAYEQGVPMPSLNVAKEVFASAKAAGLGNHDFSAIFQHLAQ